MRGIASLDREVSDALQRMPETFRNRVEHSQLTDSEKSGISKGFNEAYGSSELLASRRHAMQVEEQWVDATVDLYDFARQHLDEFVVNSNSVAIKDDTVREQFNSKLAKARQLRQNLVAINEQVEQIQRSKMKEFGITSADLGLKD